MRKIGIGVIGGGYMGKAHSVAMSAVGAMFDTALRPTLEMICASSAETSERYRLAYGFKRATPDWRTLVTDPRVQAIVIASPQETHRPIAELAFSLKKPVLCEKPLGCSLSDSEAMVAAAEAAGAVNMVGFNYICTPASQFVRTLLAQREIGTITWFRGEHAEDFDADPSRSANWRNFGRANGTMGDLAPHMINAALTLVGPIDRLCANIASVYTERPGLDGQNGNDDIGQFMCHFTNGATGHLSFSRISTGRKMGFAYEVVGSAGAIRFDQEDQNALWLYRLSDPPAERGFRKILTGPAHPDYAAFCLGAGHGTGYQDQIIIEAKNFLRAIESRQPAWPSFRDGLNVHRVIEAAFVSHSTGSWVDV
ncbi:Gfo/Idh/MocA family protein [Acidiphilium sp.]|uniref:Gfo/Idh/MocA family protein n=1 Tax=Acidiphilium sp. TaxID=527 RepID=UPI003CFF32A3